MKVSVIHTGAGNNSRKNEGQYKRLFKRVLSQPNESIEDVLRVSEHLEKSKLTNTGYGSSLDINGEVFCDAGIIRVDQGQRDELSVHSIRHAFPIRETWQLMENLDLLYCEGLKFDKLGLSRPISLDYKLNDKILELLNKAKQEVEPDDLILPRARYIYDYYMNRPEEVIEEIQDTIGIIDINDTRKLVLTSSGGNFFKLPGRIGCAGTPRCAIDFKSNGKYTFSCMCSGNGEQIIRWGLSSLVIERMMQLEADIDWCEALQSIIESCQTEQGNIYVGVIIVIEDMNDCQNNRLVYCHTTETFQFGIKRMVDNQPEIEVIMSRLQKGSLVRGEYKL